MYSTLKPYPRVLVVAIGRINAADTFSNGLLLRNLFGAWPKENLAQIYSSGDNGDQGFFGSYYKLGPQDRRLGKIFYRLKNYAQSVPSTRAPVLDGVRLASRRENLKSILTRRLVESGVYELVFKPRISEAMASWIRDVRPEVILAQGFNITFACLPVWTGRKYKIPIMYYPTDDWPSDLYSSGHGCMGVLRWIVRRAVARTSRALVDRATTAIAFNHFMRQEYQQRYDREFSVLMHGDDMSRFAATKVCEGHSSHKLTIACIGTFDWHRMPLLKDIDEACEILMSRGLKIGVTVFPAQDTEKLSGYKHLFFMPCPSHEELPAVLREADILFLPERFDETSHDIRLSISSKAPLFLFSGKPTIVYSEASTGIARYAREERWAEVVSDRDPRLLADSIERLIRDTDYCRSVVVAADRTARKNHNLTEIQATFLKLIHEAINGKDF